MSRPPPPADWLTALAQNGRLNAVSTAKAIGNVIADKAIEPPGDRFPLEDATTRAVRLEAWQLACEVLSEFVMFTAEQLKASPLSLYLPPEHKRSSLDDPNDKPSPSPPAA